MRPKRHRAVSIAGVTPAALALLLLSLAGVSALRWATRLAPLLTELPAKTLIATVLAVLALAGEMGWAVPARSLSLAAIVLAPLYVFGPVALLALVRSGRARWAAAGLRLLYWTALGRRSLGRWLAVAALHEGDPAGALAVAPEPDDLLAAQAALLEGRWDAALEHARRVVQGPYPEDAKAVARELAVAAHLELGELEAAAAEARLLTNAFDQRRDGPMKYRAVTLANARVAAANGDLMRVRELLSQPLAGVRPATLFAVLGRAADRAGQEDLAVESWRNAFADARGVLKERYAEVLRSRGAAPVTKAPSAVPVATYALVGAIVLAYLGQSLLNGALPPVRLIGVYLDPSDFILAYAHGIPGVPAQDAWWRYLTYGFLHANLIHIAFNAWVLLDLGRVVERRRGWGDMVASFVAGVAGGALLTSVLEAGRPMLLVGASGGVFSVAAALTLDALTRRSRTDMALLRSMATFLALNLVFSLLPGVSLWGHVGGLLAGALYMVVRRALPWKAVGSAFGALGVAALVLALGTALVTVVPLL